jgi:hypothetical protein
MREATSRNRTYQNLSKTQQMQQDLKKFFINQYNSLRLNQNLPRSANGRAEFRPNARKGSCMMRASIRSSIVSRLAGAVAGVWLCGAGVAWAGGGGGADLASIQAIIGPPNGSSGLCLTFGMNPCPQLPTVTQAILQSAGLGNNLPEMVGAQNNIPPGDRVSAGNPAAVPPPQPSSLSPLPLNSTTSPTVSQFLATLTPLAFISQSSGTAQATQLFNGNADTFLYAVGVSSSGKVGTTGLTDPDMVYFIYEDLFQKNQKFATGQTVAKFLFPLTVLSKDAMGKFSERAVPITLNFRATIAGDCSASTVSGDFNGTGNPLTLNPPNAIGIDCAVVFSASPTSTQTHAIFEVAVPLLVTGRCFNNCPPDPNTDPAYFYSVLTGNAGPVNKGVFTAFLSDDANRILAGASIGLASTAGPLGSPPASGSSTFALCATLPATTNGSAAQLRPAVGAYYAMAASGEMLISAPLPLPGVSSSACPSF